MGWGVGWGGGGGQTDEKKTINKESNIKNQDKHILVML